MLYNILIHPLVKLTELVYLAIHSVLDSYGFSLLILSIVSGIFIYLLNRIFEKYPRREKHIQAILKPQLARINSESTGSERHERITALYKRYSYNPILSLRTAIPVFIQLPFLIAAYFMLRELKVLEGVGFLFIEDLSKSDHLLFGINLFPFIMTLINISTAFVSDKFSAKERIQAIIIALIFFVLLYDAPSALLIYWTMNNLIFLTRTIIESKASISFAEANPFDGLTIRQIWMSMIGFIKRNKLDVIFKVYLSYLILFTIYQTLAAVEPIVFLRAYRKLLPFFGITLLLWIINIIELLKSYKNKRHELILLISNISLIFLGISAILNNYLGLVKVDSELNLRLQLIFFGFLMFIISFFSMYLRRYKAVDSKKISFLGFLFIAISSLIPAIYLAFNNTDYLAGIYYFYYFAVFILFAIINYYWTVIFTKGFLSKEKVILLSAGFSFLFVALPIIRANFAWNNRIDLEFWLLLALVMLLINVIKGGKIIPKLLYIEVIFILIFSLYNFIISNDNQDKTVFNSEIPEILEDIKFKETPNIYLFVYDGIPNERVFKNDNLSPEKLVSILKKYNFKFYKDTYSLSSTSLASMARTLNICSYVAGNACREIYGGNSLVNKVLRDKGYKTYILLDDFLTGPITKRNYRYFEEIYPPRNWDVNMNFFAALMRGVFQGEMKFNTLGLTKSIGYTETDQQNRKIELIKMEKEKSFIINHYHYPGHSSNRGRLYSEDKTNWISRLNISLEQMERDFESIEEFDPNSIVIAIGDHGPALTGDGSTLRRYKKEEITVEMVWDRIGTMVAIHWPNSEKAAKYDYDLKINQDIFSIVFSYMSGDEKYQSLKPDCTFRGYKKVFKEGKFIDDNE